LQTDSVPPFDGAVSKADSMFIDMNGDHYPDLVTRTGIRFNHVTNPGGFDPTLTEGGSFDNPEKPITSPTGTSAALSELNRNANHQVAPTVGISSAVGPYSGEKAPSWVSVLPQLGVGYGHAATTVELIDINGDGLPDQVLRDNMGGHLYARLNLGY